MVKVHKYALATVLHDFCRYKISCSTRPSPYLHSHDYFEFIIISNGQSTHYVNKTSIKMKKGDVAFIRPKDIHRCIPNGSDFEFYNIAVEPNLVTILFSFLGDDFDPKPYLEKTLPPTVTLLASELNSVISSADRLIRLYTLQQSNIEYLYRVFVLDLFARLISTPVIAFEKNIPGWFKSVITEMMEPANYVEGISAMYRISGVSPGYLSRTCLKYKNKTPTEIVNSIRLMKAVNLLDTTELPIMDIAMDVGFNNLSHFYHQFKKVYGYSPNKFRQEFMYADDHLEATKQSDIEKGYS